MCGIRIRFHRPLLKVHAANPSLHIIDMPLIAPHPTPVGHNSLIQQSTLEKSEINKLLEAIATELGTHRSLLRDIEEYLQHAVIELSLSVSANITHRQIEAGDYDIEPLVVGLVSQFTSAKRLEIHLNPVDLLAAEHCDGMKSLMNESNCKLIPDPSVLRGECCVENGVFGIVSDLPSRIQAVRQAMLSQINHDRS